MRPDDNKKEQERIRGVNSRRSLKTTDKEASATRSPPESPRRRQGERNELRQQDQDHNKEETAATRPNMYSKTKIART